MYRTKQREELLEYMASRAGEHITVSDICEHFKKSSKPIGTATVYRQLEKMVDQGIVTKYNIDSGTPACFEYIAQDSDHRDDGSCYHCKCEKCGRLIHLHCADVKELEKHLGKEHGFTMDPKRTVFYGICDRCSGRRGKTCLV